MAKASKTKTEPIWHPDFRIPDELPDIKPIRTTFLVNFIVFLLFLFLAGYYTFQNLRVQDLEKQVDQGEAQVAARRPDERKAVELDKEFRGEIDVVNDVVRFGNGVYDLREIIIALSEACPENISWRKLSLTHEPDVQRRRIIGRRLLIQFEAILHGKEAEDIFLVEEYSEQLRQLPIFEDVLVRVDNSRPSVVEEGRFRFAFTVTIRLKRTSPF